MRTRRLRKISFAPSMQPSRPLLIARVESIRRRVASKNTAATNSRALESTNSRLQFRPLHCSVLRVSSLPFVFVLRLEFGLCSPVSLFTLDTDSYVFTGSQEAPTVYPQRCPFNNTTDTNLVFLLQLRRVGFGVDGSPRRRLASLQNGFSTASQLVLVLFCGRCARLTSKEGLIYHGAENGVGMLDWCLLFETMARRVCFLCLYEVNKCMVLPFSPHNACCPVTLPLSLTHSSSLPMNRRCLDHVPAHPVSWLLPSRSTCG